MDKRLIAIMGGASALALSAAAYAEPVQPAPQSLAASSFEDLLQTPTNATDILRANDQARLTGSTASQPARLIEAQFYHHHHHHHHHHHAHFFAPPFFPVPHCYYRRVWVWGPYGRHLVTRRICD